jgi:hypothetical protein
MLTWTSRELPVLQAMVEYLDDPAHTHIGPAGIAELSGLDEDQVVRALRALAEATPPFIQGSQPAQCTYPVLVTGVSERARRAVGQWPSGEQLAEELLRRLQQAADDEPDPERRGRLRQATTVLGGVARDVVVEVASAVAARSMGL